jgi:hypothetical protein
MRDISDLTLISLVSVARVIDQSDHHQHYRHLDQDTDHGRQGRTEIEAEETDGGGDRRLEKVAGPDQCRRTGNVVLFPDRRLSQLASPAWWLFPL